MHHHSENDHVRADLPKFESRRYYDVHFFPDILVLNLESNIVVCLWCVLFKYVYVHNLTGVISTD